MHVQFLRDVLAAYLDLAFDLAGGGEVKGKLHSQPSIHGAAEGLGKPDSHLRADAGLAADDIVEGLPGNAENLCASRH